MYGKYIYGIIDSSNENVLGISGLDSSSSVHTIAHQDLSCVVSDYFGEELSSMSKEEVVRFLLAHQVVVERVMKERTVLPVKFGTVLTTSDEVRNLLSQGHSQFVTALAWIQDKVEIEVAEVLIGYRVHRTGAIQPRDTQHILIAAIYNSVDIFAIHQTPLRID